MRGSFMAMLLTVWPIFAAAGDAFKVEAFPSRLLGRKVGIGLHVPSSASVERWRKTHPGGKLRLVLFLPGVHDGPATFRQSGLAADLDRLEASGGAAPALWLTVEHFRSWYADRKDGAFPYERFLIEELLPEMERRFQDFGGSAADRTVAGLSMGGFGALNLAARTAAFSRCVSISPALVEAPFSQVGWFLRRSLLRVFPADPEAFAPWDPWRHLGGNAELILGCGTEDKYGLAPVTRAFAGHCRMKGRAVEIRMEHGNHDWVYWRRTFVELAPWIARSSSEKYDRTNVTLTHS